METRINEISLSYRPKRKAEHWPKISSSSLAANQENQTNVNAGLDTFNFQILTFAK